MTTYHVFRRTGGAASGQPPTFEFVAELEASGAEAAIRQAAKGTQGGAYMAVPESSSTIYTVEFENDPRMRIKIA